MEKTFRVNFGSGSVEMTNFEYVEELIFDEFFKYCSDYERENLVSDAAAMAEYVSTLDEVYQEYEDEELSTLPLSDEEKARIAQDLRDEYQRRLEEEKEEEE